MSFRSFLNRLEGYAPGGLGPPAPLPTAGDGMSSSAYVAGNFAAGSVTVGTLAPWLNLFNGDKIFHVFTVYFRVISGLTTTAAVTLAPGYGQCLPTQAILSVSIDSPTSSAAWFYTEDQVPWSSAPGRTSAAVNQSTSTLNLGSTWTTIFTVPSGYKWRLLRLGAKFVNPGVAANIEIDAASGDSAEDGVVLLTSAQTGTASTNYLRAGATINSATPTVFQATQIGWVNPVEMIAGDVVEGWASVTWTGTVQLWLTAIQEPL